MTAFIKSWLVLLFWLPELIKTIFLSVTGRYYLFRDSCDEFLSFLAWFEVAAGPWQQGMDLYFTRAKDERERRAIVKRSRA